MYAPTQTHTGILLSSKKERGSDTCCNMVEPWKHDAEWKKTKGHLLSDSIYIKCIEYEVYRDRT